MNNFQISIAYLYPKSMNIYGDTGNIIAFTRRCQWQEIKTKVKEIEIGEAFNPKSYDLIFAGGGQDVHQLRIAKDLFEKKAAIHEAVEDNTVILLICGTYQLFGHYFKTAEGVEIPGISVLDITTTASNKRKIGNTAVEWFNPLLNKSQVLVGFENHSGNTYINKFEIRNPKSETNSNSQNAKQQNWENETVPLGKVIHGFGNNGEDGYEGARYKNCFGTYLHGSLLPKNPHFTDYLLSLALERKYHEPVSLSVLDDTLEEQAHQFVLSSRMKE